MDRFAEFLYALRKEQGMTQAELADKLGITNKAVSKWETGEAFPETSQLVPLSKIFGVTVDELLNGRRAAPQPAEQAPEEEVPCETRAERLRPPYWKTLFAAGMCAGLALIFCGVIAEILVSTLLEEDSLFGVYLLLSLVAAAVFLFVYLGILHDKLFLPAGRPDWKRRVKGFALSVAVGIVLIFAAAMLFVSISGRDKIGQVALLCAGLAVAAAAVCLIAVAGIRWDAYYRAAAPDEYRLEKQAESKSSRSGAVCGGIMLAAALAFFLAGFLGGHWHPGWVAFPAGGILCGIVSPFLKDKDVK